MYVCKYVVRIYVPGAPWVRALVQPRAGGLRAASLVEHEECLRGRVERHAGVVAEGRREEAALPRVRTVWAVGGRVHEAHVRRVVVDAAVVGDVPYHRVVLAVREGLRRVCSRVVGREAP